VVQEDTEFAPTTLELVPAGHAVQDVAPGRGLPQGLFPGGGAYVPAAHAEHVEEFPADAVPPPQRCASVPPGQKLPPGQGLQLVAPIA
jgi:hypothetical protein